MSQLEARMIRKVFGLDVAEVAGRRTALVVGEAPGHSHHPRLPLFPHPSGTAGHRLLQLSGLDVATYLRTFARVNLLDSAPPGGWSAKMRDVAVQRAATLVVQWPRVICLGAKVADAVSRAVYACWGIQVPLDNFQSASLPGLSLLRLPHPSGRSRALNDPAVRAEYGRRLRHFIGLDEALA